MNSLKNVTVPLTANLNMNRNKSLTCSSYDILNGVNAPVFGGSISPLHYKIDYQGDAKYSVDGERWTMDSNKLYRGGLLFKDFTGEYTFDMIDTKLDLDGVVVNGNEYVGIKIANNRVDFSKLNSNFVSTASGTITSFATSDVFKGFKLFKRLNSIYLIIGYETVNTNSVTPFNIKLYTWNGNSFTERTHKAFAFGVPTDSDNTEKLTAQNVKNPNTFQWFFTVSSTFNVYGGSHVSNDTFGVTIFRSRPNGVNTFAGIYFVNFFVKTDMSIEQISLRSGYHATVRAAIDGGSMTSRNERYNFAYFVDNQKCLMAVGHLISSNTYDWCQMMNHFNNIAYMSASVDGFESYGATNETPSALLLESGQNDFAQIKQVGSSCLTVNYNGYGRLAIAGYGSVSTNSSNPTVGAPTVDYIFDSQFTMGIWNAGVTSNASLPTTNDGWVSWWNNRKVSGNTAWNPAGMRAQIGNTNFYTLFNGKEGNAAGISYAVNSSHVGTLLTEWGSIVQTFENCATADKVIFKDAKTNTVKYIQRRSNITLDDVEVVGKYLLVRCTADENIYDINSGKWAKFSNDWNNRIFFGYQAVVPTDTWNEYNVLLTRAVKIYSNSWATSGSIAAGYDVAFQKEKGFAPSRLYNYTSLSGIVLGEVNAFGYELTSENGLDVFASSGTSAPAYKTTLFGNGASSSVSNLAGGVYPITSSGSAYFNIPIIESTVVDSYNGKYGLKIDGSVYTIAYDGIRPIALYNTSSIVDQVDDFFIVQSQYYALINGYICSLSYSSSNVISGVEQIVNVQGMKFIGAFPSCAYFYSPSARAIFAFTGDADLQLFVQTDRITEVYNSKYYPNAEWIFMSTDDGLYCMTQNNTFKIDAMNVKRFFPTDDDYLVMVLDNETNDNIFISMSKPNSSWNTMPVVLETSFFGEGDMRKSTITDWYIRVFKGDEDYNGTVKCSAKTITDVVSQVVKTFDGTKEEKLTKDKFDSNDNAMITFHTGCNALGTSCRVESSYPISYFGFSIGSDGSTNKAKLNI